jgi:hypothetical protein
MAVAVINVSAMENCPRFDLPQHPSLDSFQGVFGISLESLEKTVFPFASRRGLKYRWFRHNQRTLAFS